MQTHRPGVLKALEGILAIIMLSWIGITGAVMIVAFMILCIPISPLMLYFNKRYDDKMSNVLQFRR